MGGSQSKGIIYSGINNLSRHDSVIIGSGSQLSSENYEKEESLMIHLTVTGQCYARCKGCVNAAITMGSDQPRNAVVTFQDTEPKRDTAIIKELANLHPGRVITLCFYGGEPFLAIDKMESVWRTLNESDTAKKFRFMVYTNGELLIDAMELYPDFIKDIWLYSISIDGDDAQHNKIRQGTDLAKIRRNLKKLSKRYKGHILQWSTLREDQSLFNCFEEFLRLHKKGLVNHFFWHWAEVREPFVNFPAYVRNYGQDLEQVMDLYVKKISGGELLPIAHINELILYLIKNEVRGHTACGVELAQNYDIVSGKVYPCADLPSSLSIGELDKHGRLNLKEYELTTLVEYKNWLGCYQCGIHSYCGGRCPVQIVAGTPERALQYCQLMRLHVRIVKERISDILDGLRQNGITLQALYDRSAFLAKYTDVVP